MCVCERERRKERTSGGNGGWLEVSRKKERKQKGRRAKRRERKEIGTLGAAADNLLMLSNVPSVCFVFDSDPRLSPAHPQPYTGFSLQQPSPHSLPASFSYPTTPPPFCCLPMPMPPFFLWNAFFGRGEQSTPAFGEKALAFNQRASIACQASMRRPEASMVANTVLRLPDDPVHSAHTQLHLQSMHTAWQPQKRAALLARGGVLRLANRH